jgi:hypothetical protein
MNQILKENYLDASLPGSLSGASKFLTCFKRTRDKGNSRKIKRLSELRTHVHLAQTGEEKEQEK